MPLFVMLTAYWNETPVLIPVGDIRLVVTRRRRPPREIDQELAMYRETLERYDLSTPPPDPSDAVSRYEDLIARLLRERDEADPGSVVVLNDREQAVVEDVVTVAERIHEAIARGGIRL
jgi:hypothetical protein